MLAALRRERKMFARKTKTHEFAAQRGRPPLRRLKNLRKKQNSCHPDPTQRVRDLLFAATQHKAKRNTISWSR
jgi:hypothetical protein